MYSANNRSNAPARRYVPNAPYRVAHDLNGDWWIWRRSSQNAWTTYQRCESEAEAQSLCNDLIAGDVAPAEPKNASRSTEIRS